MQTERPTEERLLIRTSSYPILASQTSLDAPRLATTLEKSYDQVKLVGQDWVRIGLWSREPTLGRTQAGHIFQIKEMVTSFLYLRPRAGLYVDQLDVFSVMNHEKSESDLDDSAGPFNKIVGGRYEYTTEDDRNSGIPIYSVMWDERDPIDNHPIRSVMQLGNRPWSSIPEDDRQKIESGLLSFTAECDYQTSEGLSLKAITWWNANIDLYLSEDLERYTPFSDQSEIRLASAVGGILNTVFNHGSKSFFLNH